MNLGKYELDHIRVVCASSSWNGTSTEPINAFIDRMLHEKQQHTQGESVVLWKVRHRSIGLEDKVAWVLFESRQAAAKACDWRWAMRSSDPVFSNVNLTTLSLNDLHEYVMHATEVKGLVEEIQEASQPILRRTSRVDVGAVNRVMKTVLQANANAAVASVRSQHARLATGGKAPVSNDNDARCTQRCDDDCSSTFLSTLPSTSTVVSTPAAETVTLVRTVFEQHMIATDEAGTALSDALRTTPPISPFEVDSYRADVEMLQAKVEQLRSQAREFCRFIRLCHPFDTVEKRNRAHREAARLQQRLPILAMRSEIVGALSKSPFVVVKGATGSGKSTQVPQYLAEAIPQKKIICTEPRKVAALTLAERVASEWGGTNAAVGSSIGYRVPGSSRTSCDVRIEFVTESSFLSLLQAGGDGLRDIGAVVVDEAHERSIKCDLLLGRLKVLTAANPDLKVVVTSATLDTRLLTAYLGCDLVEIPGRTYPVRCCDDWLRCWQELGEG